jgi:maltose alpha-D-glucosyltransferase/alpha-amylase
MLAEANVTMDKLPLYFGDGDRMHMLFHFMANQHLFASLALETARPLVEALKKMPNIPALAQWTQFLRVHDELDLGRLDEKVRQKVYEAFAPEENMRIYNRGIRRRLAPMLGNDRRRIELANSLMLTLPGTPVIRYGQEIGMGDCLSLPERNSVRTSMQWSKEKNGGFSTASKHQLARPVIEEGEFSYEHVNVADQRRDRDSLLHWMQNAVYVRKQSPEFGTGQLEIIEVDEPSVFAHRCKSPHGTVIALHNLSGEPVSISVDLGEEGQHLIDLLGNQTREKPHTDLHHVELDGYGYRWFRLHNDAS